jgi:hypothetical protein
MTPKRANWITIAILLAVTATLTYSYFFLVEEPYLRQRSKLHAQILNATAVSPYRYRVLAPLVCEGMTRAFSLLIPHDWAFYLAYGMLDFASIFLLLAALYLYLREWFTWEQALLGVFFTGAVMPMALRDHYYQPWSLLEGGLFAVSLLTIRNNQRWMMLILVVLASLNRETAVFIPLTFLLANLDVSAGLRKKTLIKSEPLLWCGAYLLAWLAIFAGLRLLQGSAPLLHTVSELLARNTKPVNLVRTLVNTALLFGPFWVFAALGLRNAPDYLKRVSLIIPCYLATIAVWGVWYEVRLLLPLYPILIPLGLAFLFGCVPNK